MIRTSPIPIAYLTDRKFVLGRRVTGILREPFGTEALQKRVLNKNGEKTKAKMAYYIDTRALNERLDQVAGPNNWSTRIHEIKDCGDRIIVVANLTLGCGGVDREDAGEELKMTEKWDKVAKAMVPATNELCVMKGGPQAIKRAAVQFGVGAYLYEFSEINTWEDIDQYGQPKEREINTAKLPEWARPTAGPMLVTREIAYILNITLPEDIKTVAKADVDKMREGLSKYFGITSLTTGYARADYIELASLIARCSDYLDVNGGTLDNILAEMEREKYPISRTVSSVPAGQVE